jgi:hypothetical protein
LEHRFWVLSALAVLLPPIGWWVTTGDMATKTDKRTKEIEGKVKTLQGLNKDLAKVANKDWIKSVEEVNVQLAGRVDETHKQLYEHQRPAMVWWPVVRKPLEEAKVKHRGDNPANPQAFNVAKRMFMTRYGDMWETDVYKVVEPFDLRTGDGKVLCSEPNMGIQILRAPAEAWQQRQNISTQEMWDAQEDLWMLHALMKAIAHVNEGSTNIDNARIKKLISATLRGGNGPDLADRRKKKDSKTGGGAPGAPAGGKFLGGLSGMGGGSGRGSEGDYGAKELPMLESDDVFGSSEEAAVSVPGSKRSLSAGDVSAGNAWVKADSGGKWRARGFVLRLVMDHQEIPKLLTVLSEGPFPVEILQVEHKQYEFKANRQPAVSGLENEADTKKIKAAEERVSMAMNQSNLAEVMVAGVFIFYNEPSSPAAQAAAASGSPAAPANASKAAKTAPAVPTPPATGKTAQPAIPTPAASSQKNPPAGKVVNPAGASAAAPKANTPTVSPAGPTTPKSAQPVK